MGVIGCPGKYIMTCFFSCALKTMVYRVQHQKYRGEVNEVQKVSSTLETCILGRVELLLYQQQGPSIAHTVFTFNLEVFNISHRVTEC